MYLFFIFSLSLSDCSWCLWFLFFFLFVRSFVRCFQFVMKNSTVHAHRCINMCMRKKITKKLIISSYIHFFFFFFLFVIFFFYFEKNKNNFFFSFYFLFVFLSVESERLIRMRMCRKQQNIYIYRVRNNNRTREKNDFRCIVFFCSFSHHSFSLFLCSTHKISPSQSSFSATHSVFSLSLSLRRLNSSS
jgi:hypothetical protein